MTCQWVYCEFWACWTVRVSLRLYLVHLCRSLPCAGFRRRNSCLIFDLQESRVINIFPLLHTVAGFPQVTDRTVNWHVILLKKKCFCFFFYIGFSCRCPLSLVMLDYSVLSSRSKDKHISSCSDELHAYLAVLPCAERSTVSLQKVHWRLSVATYSYG